MSKKKIKKILSYSPLSLYQNYHRKAIISNREEEQKRIVSEYLSKNTCPKLQIGCGKNTIGGWLNTDLNFNSNVAYLDAGGDYPFKDTTFNFIFSEHLFEHLKEEQQLKMLSECFRLLKKEGVLRIATPSIDFLFAIYKEPQETMNENYVTWAMRHSPQLRKVKKLTANRDYDHLHVINHFFKAWGHKMIHSSSSLKSFGAQVGFRTIIEKKVGYSEFEELRNLERHFNFIPKEMNEMETMVHLHRLPSARRSGRHPAPARSLRDKRARLPHLQRSG